MLLLTKINSYKFQTTNIPFDTEFDLIIDMWKCHIRKKNFTNTPKTQEKVLINHNKNIPLGALVIIKLYLNRFL